MLSVLYSGALQGIEAVPVTVEVDISFGLPGFNLVGLPDSAIKEARERVFSALKNAGFEVPSRRVTINLAPADLRKEGSALDLPMALGILAASEQIPAPLLEGVMVLGELALDGGLRPARGILSMVLAARKQGLHSVLLPAANAREAALVPGIRLPPADTLARALEALRTGVGVEIPAGGESVAASADLDPDFREIKGHAQAKRALEVAAAGGHNFLMAGSPGCGKTLMARRLPSILPPLSDEEGLEATRIYSVAGLLRPGHGIMRQRPFRAPHHSISDQALVGGGKIPRPGEVSLAHLGVLFLDELPEFRKSTLETLRQPLEDGSVTIARTAHTVTYPSRCMLGAAMNPCWFIAYLRSFQGNGEGLRGVGLGLSGSVVEFELHFLLVDGDTVNDGFNDFAFFLHSKGLPTGEEVSGFCGYIFPRNQRNFEYIPLGLDLGQFVGYLLLAGSILAVLGGETRLVDSSGLVKVVELVDFPAEFLLLLEESISQGLLGLKVCLPFFEVGGKLLRRHDELLQFLLKNPLQVSNGHFVSALLAGVLRGFDHHVHLGAAVAENEPGEQVGHWLGGADARLPVPHDFVMAFLPEVIRDDGRYGVKDPLTFVLLDPGFAAVVGLGVVGAADALGGLVKEKPFDGSVRELGPATGTISPFVENAGDGLAASGFLEKLVHERPNRSFVGMRHHLTVYPVVSKGCRASGRPSHFCSNGNGSRYAGGKLLSLKGGHTRDHRIEEATGRGRGVDGFTDGDKVGIVLPEEFRELQKLHGVAGKAGELGENESLDVPALHVCKHPFGFGVFLDVFPRDSIKPVHFGDMPTLGFGVCAGTALVGLGGFPFDLVFSRDPNPEPDSFEFFFRHDDHPPGFGGSKPTAEF